MTANIRTTARIDGTVKDEAATALATMGLTISDAVRMLLTRVAHDKALPFELLRPNAETVDAMEEARLGNAKSFSNVEALMADLNSDD